MQRQITNRSIPASNRLWFYCSRRTARLDLPKLLSGDLGGGYTTLAIEPAPYASCIHDSGRKQGSARIRECDELEATQSFFPTDRDNYTSRAHSVIPYA